MQWKNSREREDKLVQEEKYGVCQITKKLDTMRGNKDKITTALPISRRSNRKVKFPECIGTQ